jgi:alanine racemase
MHNARQTAAAWSASTGTHAATAPHLEVNLSALRANCATLKAVAGPTELAAAIKADAYGLGVADVAPVLWREGVQCFFVANTEEGVALRTLLAGQAKSASSDGPPRIAILNGCLGTEWARAKAFGLEPVLNSLEAVASWRAAGFDQPCILHVDSGMNRLGLTAPEATSLATLKPSLVMSHLACADTPEHPLNQKQLAAFNAVLSAFGPETKASLSASGGLLLGKAYHFDLIRSGIALYGGGGLPAHRRHAVGRLIAPVVLVRSLLAGESIGYGATATALRPLTVAIAAIGYADGFLRSASSQGMGWLAGQYIPVLGRVSMDLTAFDITDLAEQPSTGDMIELFGTHLDIEHVAGTMNTISYEVLTSLRGPRMTRSVRL